MLVFCGDSNIEEERKILTGKVTGFKSLRLNCWKITQVIWICIIFSSILTFYYIQLYLLKR